jgi:hypothetical protein
MASEFALPARPIFIESERDRKALGLKLALGFVLFANAYAGSGVFGVKYIAFAVACVISGVTLKYLNLSYFEFTVGLFLFAVWPLWSLLYGTVQGGDTSVGIRQISTFLFVLVLPGPLSALDLRTPLRIYYACFFSLAIFLIISLALVFFFPQNPISMRLFDIFIGSLDTKEGFFGFKDFGNTTVPIIYFGSTLFFVPTCIYYLFAGKTFRAGIAFLALALSFSKAGIVIVLAFSLIYFVSMFYSPRALNSPPKGKAQQRRKLRLLLPVLVLILLIYKGVTILPEFSQEITDTVGGESYSAQVRIDHIHSVMDLFSDNPHFLLTGQGVGVPFYTKGFSEYTQNFEVDHLNTIRKFGLPWFLAFSAIVFFSAAKLIVGGDAERKGFGFALISMYLVAGTNPMLMAPNFIILLMFCYFAQRKDANELSGLAQS